MYSKKNFTFINEIIDVIDDKDKLQRLKNNPDYVNSINLLNSLGKEYIMSNFKIKDNLFNHIPISY